MMGEKDHRRIYDCTRWSDVNTMRYAVREDYNAMRDVNISF